MLKWLGTGLKTEVITNNPIKESYNVEYGKVKIKNQTDYKLTQEMLTPNITIENKNIHIVVKVILQVQIINILKQEILEQQT